MDTGKPIFSFPDHLALGWVALLAGLFTLAGGLTIAGLVAAEGVRTWNGDSIAVVVLVLGLVALGGFFAFGAARDMIGKPTWHVSSTHVWRVRGGRTTHVFPLAEQKSATVVDLRRGGATLWFEVRFDERRAVVAPSEATARQIAGLWERARPR